MPVRIVAGPVKRHGLELWQALVLDTDDRVLWSGVRWSETQARREAERAAQKLVAQP
jgi:hypothetical protein